MNSSNTTGSIKEHKPNVTATCIDDEAEWKTPFTLLLTIGPLVLIIVGTIGNTISFFVLKRRAYEKNIMSIALRYLAMVDNTILWTFVLKIFVEGAFEYDIGNLSHQACALWSFYAFSISSIDSWLLVVISATRLIHIKYPFAEHNICSKSHYYIALYLMHVAVLIAHGSVQHLVFLEMPKDEGPLEMKCALVLADIERKSPYLMAITASVNFIAPCILLIIFTIFIMQGLKTVDRRKSYFHPPSDTIRKSAFGGLFPNTEDVDTTQNALSCKEKQLEKKRIPLNGMVSLKCKTIRNVQERGTERMGSETCILPHTRQDPFRNRRIRQAKTTMDTRNGGYLANESIDPFRNRRIRQAKTTMNTRNEGYLANESIDSTVQSKHANQTCSAFINDNNNTINTDHEDRRPSILSKRSQAESRAEDEADIENASVGVDAAGGKKPRKLHTTFEDGIKGDDDDEDNNDVVENNKYPNATFERTSRVSGLTRILVAACIVFFILNIPFWGFYIFISKAFSGNDVGCYFRRFVVQSAILVKCSNHSVNFFFYSATCSRFREELRDMFKGRHVPRVSIAVY